jgi:hypothetical protein
MKKLSFYEQVGIVTPGAVFLFGLIFYFPELKEVFAKDGFSVGGLGVYVIISYASGHLLAALGNGIEKIWWYFFGGMPSNWVIGSKPRLLSTTQIYKVETLIAARFGLKISPLSELVAKDWFPIFRQIYSDVEKNGKPNRADTFNGIYGLNRGLCSATLALSGVIIVRFLSQWVIGLVLFLISLAYLYRMHRFGVHYAREIYNQFLLLPPEPAKPKKSKKVTDGNNSKATEKAANANDTIEKVK